MATSGSNTVTVANATTGEVAVQLRLSWSTVSQNVTGNSSVVRFTLQVITGRYGAMYGSATKTWNISVDGVQRASGAFTVSQGANSTKTLGTVDVTIGHNSDGTKTFSASGFAQFRMNFNGYKGDYSVGLNGALNTIPRASTPSVGSARTIGSTISISTNRASSNFTHTLSYKFGSASGTIATGVGASVNWTPPMSLCNQVPGATSGTLTITCVTYSGSTNIGTKTASVSLNVPSSLVPSFTSSSVGDALGYMDSYGALVQGKSRPRVTVTAQGSYGSTISRIDAEFEWSIGGANASGSPATVTFDMYPYQMTPGSRTLKLTATDSRGRKITGTKSVTVAAYSGPTLANLRAFRSTGGVEDDESSTIRVSFDWTALDVNSKGVNKCSVKIEWKLNTSSSWTTAYSAQQSGYSGRVNHDLTGKANTQVFNIRVTVSDSFGSTASNQVTVSTATPVLDFLDGGKGLGVGRVSSRQDVMDVGWFIDAQAGLSNRKPNFTGQGSLTHATYYTSHSTTAGYIRLGRLRFQTSYMQEGANAVIDVSSGDGYGSLAPVWFLKITIRVSNAKSQQSSGVKFNVAVFGNGDVIQKNVTVVPISDEDPYRVCDVYLKLDSAYSNAFYTVSGEFSSWEHYGNYVSSVPSGGELPVSVQVRFPGLDSDSHINMANNAALTGKTTSGSIVSLLRMNPSNQVELNWTSGGIKGRVMKQLWSGVWSSGSITVAELPYYNVFAFGMSTGIAGDTLDGYFIGIRDANNGITAGGVSASGSDIRINGAFFKASGTTLAYQNGLNWAIINASGLANYKEKRKVMRIYGLL